KVTFTEAKENVQIGIIAIDYNGDGKVNSTDVALASKTKEIGQKITVDQFKSILKSGVNYATLS
ncbi:MAG: dockerin type I domain-containing protein, partial [Eubacterium sp.]